MFAALSSLLFIPFSIDFNRLLTAADKELVSFSQIHPWNPFSRKFIRNKLQTIIEIDYTMLAYCLSFVHYSLIESLIRSDILRL